MKYLFFVFSVIFGLTACTTQKKVPNEFLKIQLGNARKSFENSEKLDEKKARVPYELAVLFDKKCEGVISILNNSGNTEMVRESLRGLKMGANMNYGVDSLLRENAESVIELLIRQTDYSNTGEIVDQINLIDYSYWIQLSECPHRNDYAFDYIKIITKDQVGVAGKEFKTELLPASLSSTENYLIRVGTSLDNDKHLMGKIDTLGHDESYFPIYKVSNPTKGVYDIPAEVTPPPGYGGKSNPFIFMIHYEIK
jgi:hypothetical protein